MPKTDRRGEPPCEHDLSDEHDRQGVEIKRLHAETVRLSGCLIAINGAADTASATVLRGVAYDAALNCISPDVARYQIERRTMQELEHAHAD